MPGFLTDTNPQVWNYCTAEQALSLALILYQLVYSPQSSSHSFQLSNLPDMLKNTHTSNTYNGLEVKFGQVHLHDGA